MTKMNVRIGDVIRIIDWKGAKPDGRHIGTVINLQNYSSTQKVPYHLTDSISEVMWQDGRVLMYASKYMKVIK